MRLGKERGKEESASVSQTVWSDACYLTMLLTIWREMVRKEREKATAV